MIFLYMIDMFDPDNVNITKKNLRLSELWA